MRIGLVAVTVPASQAIAAPAGPSLECESSSKLTIINFNDFHGRIANANPNTVAFFGQIEQYRAEAGEANSLVLANGDNIVGSLFASFSQDDNPTIDILNAAGLDASSVGNHEFDRGWPDLRDRVIPRADFPYLGANVYTAGTTPALPQYQIFDKAGVKVAVIGAVTSDLPSPVSPAGLTGLTVGDPVDAVNRVAAQLTDGDPANGEADLIIAEYHEGAVGARALAEETADSEIFAKIVNQTSPEVDAIFTAHSHQAYTYAGPVPTGTRPVIQSGSYAGLIGKVELGFDATGEVTCYSMMNNPVVISEADALTYPRAEAVKILVDRAIAESQVVGARVVGSASSPISRAMTPTGDVRNVESTMTNMVAEMFFDQLSGGDPEFIGVQNPGGTRANLDAGEITYMEAASILPFANSLMTTRITGSQFKTLLEQQWQRDAAGEVPGRPYLQLGLSSNVSYTYDESRPEGDRITSIMINGAPIDPAKSYNVGSGSFLISGGDNFRVLADGTDRRDTGRVDLEAWVDWLRAKGTLQPDYTKRGVSVSPEPTTLAVGSPGHPGRRRTPRRRRCP